MSDSNLGDSKIDTIPDVLSKIYGDHVEPLWDYLQQEHPNANIQELVLMLQEEPTCNYSFFLREPNIREIPSILDKPKNESLNILSIGCGMGPEPFELAMRLHVAGFSNFHVTGVDSSGNSIQDAKNGKFLHTYEDFIIDNSRTRYVKEMIALGLMSVVERFEKNGNVMEEVELASEIKERLSFLQADIIDGPVPGAQLFDVVICNNVLLHYPVNTRELILMNSLYSLKDGGKFLMEREELDGLGMNSNRASWLMPYYHWKKNLNRFGLVAHYYPPETWMFGDRYYSYSEKDNIFFGRRFVVRGNTLVEVDDTL